MSHAPKFVFNCETCGKEVVQRNYRRREAKYCSQACHYEAAQGPRVNTCRTCGSEFQRPNNPRREYQYCSRSCSSKRVREGALRTVTCPQCTVDFKAWPYEVRNGRRYCGSGCANAARDFGRTEEAKRVRTSKAYAEWRTAVFKRDDYTCVECGQRGGELNADHILPFAHFPDLRLELTNGRTLCVPCHRATDSFGGNGNKAHWKRLANAADSKWDVLATGVEA
ncbi:HNH endonuclease [Tsukamurella tyrosinosolvens]|uniref:HNH endonuclease n=1 Tax=Tsukamurella tyrosinosolvens TaxID=57704 RepID=UPI002DD43243|nr:HNH endonuclease [Tsukamurella tyrosinosolvens]MEC4616177.1 HNH endonuclease [Tsukamurella tyrosinosolvens]